MIVSLSFQEPFTSDGDVPLLYSQVVRLWIQYVEPAIDGYAKRTIGYTMKRGVGDRKFSLVDAISLKVGEDRSFYDQLLKYMTKTNQR